MNVGPGLVPCPLEIVAENSNNSEFNILNGYLQLGKSAILTSAISDFILYHNRPPIVS